MLFEVIKSGRYETSWAPKLWLLYDGTPRFHILYYIIFPYQLNKFFCDGVHVKIQKGEER